MNESSISYEEARSRRRRRKLRNEASCCDKKRAAFIVIGSLTLVYCIVELFVAVAFDSLVLLSDGFHNLGDVFSIVIAYLASEFAKRGKSRKNSFGWARAEVLGGLVNGAALLSLCLYIILEAIPRFIYPTSLLDEATSCGGGGNTGTPAPGQTSAPTPSPTPAPTPASFITSHNHTHDGAVHDCPLFLGITGAMAFIIVAAAGVAINTIGTIVFAFAGHAHTHAGGGGHSHGGGGGHSHGGGPSTPAKGRRMKRSSKEDKVSLLHGEDDIDHDHSHGGGKSDHGHSHGVDGESDHGHSHGDDGESGHGHSHGSEKKSAHSHAHGDDDHGHSHSGGGDHGHAHDNGGKDMNMWAVFVHFLGDMISSLFVLGVGLLFYFYGTQQWTMYIDPGASILVVGIILYTTIPLVKETSMVLMQSVPAHIDIAQLEKEIRSIDNVVSVHEFHIWQLVDGLIITSGHVLVRRSGEWSLVASEIREILHEYGIHSSSVQPEFVNDDDVIDGEHCPQNCVDDCNQNWCCKKEAEDADLEAATRGLNINPSDLLA